MNFKQLLEIRSTSLEKLGKAQAISVASDYPEDMARIMFREFAKAGYPITKKSQISVINHISESLSNSMSAENVWVSSRKDNQLRFTSESGLDIRLILNLVGNKAKWGFEANHAGVYPSDTSPIIITGMSASDIFRIIIKKASKILDLNTNNRWDRKRVEKAREEV